MPDNADVLELIKHYSSGAPDTILLKRASYYFGKCDAETRQRAIDWITDRVPRQDGKYRHELSIMDIKNALAEVGIPCENYVYADDWTCDACGHNFKYAQAVSDDDKLDKMIFDVCPMCGFQPYWSMLRIRYKEIRGWTADDEEHYQKMITKISAEWGPGKPRGIYWSRSVAEQERRDAKKIRADTIIADLDKSKRWDLKEGTNG
jgi:hypothetical protein